jgi:hypothetical protein
MQRAMYVQLAVLRAKRAVRMADVLYSYSCRSGRPAPFAGPWPLALDLLLNCELHGIRHPALALEVLLNEGNDNLVD